MCVFREHLVNLYVFRGNLVNYWGNIQIIPLGNVRLFRRIRKNDTPFLKTCVFFAEISIFRRNWLILMKTNDFPQKIPDFPETIPAYLNFGYRHIFFLYPKKLSYSSVNAYIKKIRVRELGKATRLLKNLKKCLQTYEFFLWWVGHFPIINSVAAGYHPLTHSPTHPLTHVNRYPRTRSLVRGDLAYILGIQMKS